MSSLFSELKRRNVFRVAGIHEYWREYGFPPQCRPVGEEDFECD